MGRGVSERVERTIMVGKGLIIRKIIPKKGPAVKKGHLKYYQLHLTSAKSYPYHQLYTRQNSLFHRKSSLNEINQSGYNKTHFDYKRKKNVLLYFISFFLWLIRI